MVLFKDEEHLYKKPPSRLRIVIGRLVKITLALAVFLWLSLTVLANLGGQHQALQDGVESYLGEATGTAVTIGRFENLSFFPHMALDAGAVTMRRDNQIVGEAGQVSLSIPFWELVFKRGRIAHFIVKDLWLAPGVIMEKKLVLESVTIGPSPADEDESPPGLRASGRYDDRPLSIWLEMAAQTAGGRNRLYYMPPQRALEISWGDLHLAGQIFDNAPDRPAGLLLQIDELLVPGAQETPVSGEILIGQRFWTPVLQGALKAGQSQLSIDLKLKEDIWSGTVAAMPFALADIKLAKALAGAYFTLWPQRAGAAQPSSYQLTLPARQQAHFDMSLALLSGTDQILEPVTVDVQLQPGRVTVKAEEALLAGGTLDGFVTLQERLEKEPARRFALLARLIWRGFHYDRLQFILPPEWPVHAGTGALYADMDGRAASLAALPGALSGEILALATQADLGAALPDAGEVASRRAQCLMVMGALEKGRDEGAALLLDTGAGYGTGRGAIDLAAPYHLSFDLPASSSGADAMPEAPVLWRFTKADLALENTHGCAALLGGSARPPAAAPDITKTTDKAE